MPDIVIGNTSLFALTIVSIVMTVRVALSLWGIIPALPPGGIPITSAVLTVTGLAYLWL